MKQIIAVSLLCTITALVGGCTKTANTIIGNNNNSSGDMTWTLRTAGVPSEFNFNSTDIVWGNNEFLVVGAETTLTSTDGKFWTVHASNLPYSGKIAATYGLNTFVAITDTGIFTSPDGAVWTKRYSISSSRLNALTYGGNRFVAVGGHDPLGFISGPDTAYAYVSTDGINWTQKSLGSGTCTVITWGNNRYVAIGRQSLGFISTDGTQWSQDSVNLYASSIAYGANRFVAAENIALSASPDGLSWTGLFSIGTGQAQAFCSILWDGNRFVAAGSSVLTSPDGLNWAVQQPSPFVITKMAAGNNIIVGLSYAGILTSP
jgi:hypothetical protein